MCFKTTPSGVSNQGFFIVELKLIQLGLYIFFSPIEECGPVDPLDLLGENFVRFAVTFFVLEIFDVGKAFSLSCPVLTLDANVMKDKLIIYLD